MTYLKLFIEEVEILIAKIQSELLEVVNKFVAKKECSKKEALFLLSKNRLFTVPHFYIIWKVLKNPPVGRVDRMASAYALGPSPGGPGHAAQGASPGSAASPGGPATAPSQGPCACCQRGRAEQRRHRRGSSRTGLGALRPPVFR